MRFFTFSWGKNYIAIRGLLRVLGHELATPPPVSAGTTSLGVREAHPFLCTSGKVVLGQIAEQVQNGEKNFLFMSSLGPEACRCADTADYIESRFCKYHEDFKAIRLGGAAFGGVLANLRKHFGHVSRRKCALAYTVFHMKIELLHWVDKRCTALRCLAEAPDPVRQLEAAAISRIDRARNPATLWLAGKWFKRAQGRIPGKAEPPRLRIGIVGGEHILSEIDGIMARIKDLAETGIYLDWRSGFRFLARSSGHMSLGKGVTLESLRSRCSEYLTPELATSEVFSCAHAMDFIEEGYDGILHIYAFGCMPQTALKPILQRQCQDAGMPLLTLSVGERFAEEGLENRIEAFVDLLTERKSMSQGGPHDQ